MTLVAVDFFARIIVQLCGEKQEMLRDEKINFAFWRSASAVTINFSEKHRIYWIFFKGDIIIVPHKRIKHSNVVCVFLIKTNAQFDIPLLCVESCVAQPSCAFFVKKLNCICTVEKTVLIWYNDKATQSEY